MNILHLKNYPIYQQLQLEEALLRLDRRNICIINEGASPAIVMGISGKEEDLIHFDNHAKNPLPIIRRFSGGGTVVVDEDTLFVSFLCQKELHTFALYPEPIMRWTEDLYKQILPFADFALCENDYVFGDKKFGGNAQYLRKERWLHHTTFLWDYQKERMDLLLPPKKMPNYREQRTHDTFLTSLSTRLPSKETFIHDLKTCLTKHYTTQEISLETLLHFLAMPHRKSTTLVSLQKKSLAGSG